MDPQCYEMEKDSPSFGKSTMLLMYANQDMVISPSTAYSCALHFMLSDRPGTVILCYNWSRCDQLMLTLAC